MENDTASTLGEQDHAAYFSHLLASLEAPGAPFGWRAMDADTAAMGSARVVLEAPLAHRVHAACATLGVAAASLMHLAWALVLSRISDRPAPVDPGAAGAAIDVLFGTALPDAIDGTTGTTGKIITLLPVRIEVGRQGVADSLQQMAAQLLRLQRHAAAAPALVQRASALAAERSLFGAVLCYRPLCLAHSDARPAEPAQTSATQAVALAVDELEQGFVLTAQVRAPLQPGRLCAYMLTALQHLLDALEQAPETPLERIDILPPAERAQLLVQFNATASAYPRQRCLHDLFEEQVRRAPEAIAVLHAESSRSVTYAQLNARANQLAHYLREAGIGRADHVALALGRSCELLVAQLAVLKAGAAYVPLSDVLPLERQALMLADCGARLVLASSGSGSAPGAGVTCLDLAHPAIQACPDTNLAGAGAESSRATAYVMYTSGSSGTPKGVPVPHQAIAKLVIENGFADFRASDRVAFAANPAFDASTLEVWAPLLNGGAVVIIENAVLLDPGRFGAALARHAVTVLWLTVGLFNEYANRLAAPIAQLRYLIVGGDKLDPEVIRRVLRNNPPQHLLNGYGPTETTTFAATHEIRSVAPGARSIPIGAPIANTQIYLLDEQLRPAPIGAAGEIYIGGDGLAHGYLNRPELSAASFLPNPFKPGQDERMYKSGDRGRWMPDGNIEFLGRHDLQVKIRGFRIDIGEIESVLARHAAVQQCAVIARQEHGAETRLLAYVVVAGAAPETAVLRTHLALHLPEYMLPQALVFLAALPLTVNGKLDRAALQALAPPPRQSRPQLAQPYLDAETDDERLISALFAEQLFLDCAGRLDNFFDLGGNSMGVLSLLARIQEKTGVALSAAVIFNQPTPAGVAQALRHARNGVGEDAGEGDADSARSDPANARRQTNGAQGARHDAIAIIAMSGRFPGAADTDALWRNLRDGCEAVTFFSSAELDASIPAALAGAPGYVKARAVMADVEMFDAAFFGISPREAEVMDPQQRIFLELCWDCLERGGYAPDATPRPVGVFGGMYSGSYLQHHVRAHPEAVARMGELALMLANEKDYIASRVAYRLNLTGPAVSIHSACSTSLVAVVQAMTSLRAGQCHMALAGGVAITCPPRSGYLYQEGAILSPDGHTRAFDADARGTVFGDAGAVILLKRLADAVADGDPILALLRGAALNNDGGGRASFTAPSVDGQAAVIAAALDDAGVNARAISYVEAHGTATPIGDPIEVAALTRAYRRHTNDNAYCKLGSVKSNLGHLITAAGVTGLIKTVLALQHEALPATLHYRAPNPKIDFARTPFTVNHSLSAWPRSSVPRRAGVSAFGFGGTNAHVIVEEAPAPAASMVAGTGPQLLLVSARTETALAANVAQLASHLGAHLELNLADVAHTLRTGRKAMIERLCLVADDVAGAVAVLGSGCAASAPMKARGKTTGRSPAIVFMFPGQAAQYPAMGSALYQHEPAFRSAYDACLAALDDGGSVDSGFRQRLFALDAAALAATATTQPALFCLEYALACYWIGLGVRPAALIGHSVGEFVAATIAGVFSVSDAVRLVARRGQLMQALPPGAMLAVRLPAAQLAARLPPGLSLAAENSPVMSVAAGPATLIEQLHGALENEGVSARLLPSSHAFHSAMMEPALAPFEAELRRCTLAPPKLPIYSSVTGQLLDDEQACDPLYWARHLRQPVRFSSALLSLTQAQAQPGILLEVGPRTTLSTLARQHAPVAKSMKCVASLAEQAQQELAQLRLAAGSLWVDGAAVKLDLLDQRSSKLRLTLPGYAFERQRHWLDAPAAQETAAGAASDATAQNGALSSVCQPRPDPMPDAAPPSQLFQLPQLPQLPPQPQLSQLPQEPAMPDSTAPDRIAGLIAQLRSLLEDTAGIDLANAPASASLLELGFDSLTLTQVALQLKQTFKVNISFRQLMEEQRSLDALAIYLEHQLPPPAPVQAAVQIQAAVQVQPAAQAQAQPQPEQAAQHWTRQLIEQQMQLMAQQLALLQAGAAPAAAAAAPPAAAPAQAAVATTVMTAVATEAVAEKVADEAELKSAAKYDVKKAFGAIARIHTDPGAGLSTRQRARLDAFIQRYVDATRSSKQYTEANRSHLADPRVVNGFRPVLKEIIYQIVIERSQGANLWDLDGNEYVDANNGFGMSLFGWQPSFVLDAVRQQLDAGYEIGPQHPLAGDVARLVCELTGHDRAGLCNTGSEAVMGAMRIARTVTGRNLVVLFAGAYHGIFDEVVVRASKRMRPVPGAPGILPNTTENVLVLEYGTEESLAVLASRIDDIAAVLVEPVQSRRPDFQPLEFLRAVRALTAKSGAVLIFDEVISGFRAAPGGVQERFGIRADICTYGKVIGGGFPIGVIAGKRAYLDALDGGAWRYGDASVPTVGVTYFAGTFVRHPLALAAAKAALTHLKREGPALQARLDAATAQLAATLNAFCREVGAPIEVRHFSSLWKIFFTEEHALQDLLFAMMRNRGVHIMDHFPCFLTTAHTEQDLARIRKAFMEAVAELQDGDFISRHPGAGAARFDASRPPLAGARLGKDMEGNPAWFLPDLDNPGNYVRIDQ